MLLFTPETVLRWHHELVRRRWTFPHRGTVGRPRIAGDLEALIVRMAQENPRSRLQYNRRRTAQAWLPRWALDHSSSAQAPAYRGTCPRVLGRAAPGARASRQHQHQRLSCDFFTVETVCFKTLDVLFFMELGTRRVHVAGCTARPTARLCGSYRHDNWCGSCKSKGE
jgi:hypothetical protein